jgi:hypothetical protein
VRDAQAWGGWASTDVALAPIVEPARLRAAVAVALLPITVTLDLALLPLEAVFVLARL